MGFTEKYIEELIAAVILLLVAGTIAIFRKSIVSIYMYIRERFAFSKKRFKKVNGKIVIPKNNTKVNRKIEVSGSCANLKRNLSLWIFVSIDGLIWPKEKLKIENTQSWSTEFKEFGVPDDEELKILLVCSNKYGNSQIDAYFRQCSTNNSFPGVERFSGTLILDEVSITI